jgi:trk system potassium uptake protein TrkA
MARAGDDLYERILGLVGAHQVFNPELAFGHRLALQLIYGGVLEEFPLGEHMVITEVRVPPALVGRTLRELALPVSFGVNVMAIQRGADIEVPTATTVVGDQDVLVTVSRPGAVAFMLKRLS